MKKVYACLPALFFVYFNSNAQLTLTKAANEPVSGDTRSMVHVDSTTVVPKNTGAGQSWNFTSLINNNSFTEVTTYTTVASTPGSAFFPGATLASQRGGHNYEYFKSSGSNWEFMGDFDSNSGDMLSLSNTAIFNVWPISFGSSNTDLASGNMVSSSVTTAESATLSYAATGSGTVTMPSGTIHNNCLQVVMSITIAAGSGTNTSVANQKTYYYYSSAKKLPIIELEYKSETTLSVTTRSFNAYADNSGVIIGLDPHGLVNAGLTIYPVPANNWLNIELPSEYSLRSIEIFDLNGKLLISTHNNVNIDISALPQSCYLMRVTGSENVYQRILPVFRN